MKKRSAFTLIELLIVIAIIGILASLIAMGVSSVRNSAREKHCTNNLRQLMDGVLAFAMDNGQTVPYAQSFEIYHQSTATYGHYHGWCTWVNEKRNMDDLEALWHDGGDKTSHSGELFDDRGTGPDAKFAIEYGDLFPYVGDFASYVCPIVRAAMIEQNANDDEDEIATSDIYRTYAMNPCFGGASNRHWRRVKTSWVGVTWGYGGHVPEASKLLVFGEVDGFGAKHNRGGYKEKTFGKDWRGGVCLNPEKSVYDANDQLLACHHSASGTSTKFSQGIFFDGHVERLPQTVATVNDSGEEQNKLLNTAWLVTRGWDWTAGRSKAPDEN